MPERKRASNFILIAAMALLCGCAVESPPAPPSPFPEPSRSSETHKDGIEAFLEVSARCNQVLTHSSYIADLTMSILEQFESTLEPPYDERANLIVSLIMDGRMRDIEIRSVSDERIREPLQIAIEEASPFPPAPMDIRKCVGAEPFLLGLMLFEKFQCAIQEDYYRYYDALQVALYQILYSNAFVSTPGRGRVRFSVAVGADGNWSDLTIERAPNHLTRPKIERALETLGPFPAPPEFERCFANKPLRFDLDVQGQGS